MYGGFEFRNFVYSGLYAAVSKNSDCLVLRRPFDSVVMKKLDAQYDLKTVEAPTSSIVSSRSRIDRWHYGARRARMRVSGEGNFNYFKKDVSNGKLDWLKGSRIVCNTLRTCALRQMRRDYVDVEVEAVLSDQGVTDLVLSGYSNVSTQILANTAIKRGIRVWLTINSWKDLYVNSFIGFKPAGVFVWSEAMRQHVRATNNHILDERISVAGNPAFDRFHHYTPQKMGDYYAVKYGFETTRPILLYSMLSPRAYSSEKEVIRLLDGELSRRWPDIRDRPILLLRKNPIDESGLKECDFEVGNVRIAENYWESSYQDEIYIQSAAGEHEWMDLLSIASINLNVASTVTLESLMMRVPVINIEFGDEGVEDPELCRYGDAPFYQALKGRRDVVAVKSLSECMDVINGMITDPEIDALPELLSHFDGQSVAKIVEEVRV